MHPPEETLLDFASGEADLPQRVLIEGHLSTCAACRAAVRELTLPGGALLASLAGEPLPGPLWSRVLEKVAAPGGRGAGDAGKPGSPGRRPRRQAGVDPLAVVPLPAGARSELGEVPAPRWRSALAPGARFAVIARDEGTGAFLVAAHMPPARAFPLHLHPSREDVLVLAGGYVDDTGRYDAGAYTIYPAGTCHRPATEPDEGCWILTRLEDPIRFLGWRGWLQRLALATG